MSCKPIAFESSRVKEAARQEIRDARERVLDRAKDNYDWKEKKKEQARMRGDDKWMLPSLEARLSSDKKHKKKKKKHKKKHKRKSSSESESSSSEEDQKWVEKSSSSSSQHQLSSPVVKASSSAPPVPTSDHKAERDEWMTMSGIIPCVTRNELRHSSRAAKEEEETVKKNSILENAGQSARELNPYWQDGGSGLPEAPEALEVRLAQKTVGDQGVGWLRKALQRIQEQAAETGRDPEEIAAERWGSLGKLKSLLAEAEDRKKGPEQHKDTRHSHRDDRRSADNLRSRDSRERSHEDRHDRSKGRSFHRPHDEYEDKYKPRHRGDSRNNKEDSRREDSSVKGKFMKPSDDGGETSGVVHRVSGSRNWQKKEVKSEPIKREPPPRQQRKLSSSSSSDDEPEEPEPVKLLTDKEMNDIGAKIVKAEIFGNEALAKELKSQLEMAREARENAKTAGISVESKEEEVVILTRTNSRGMTRPLETPQYQEPSGGRRKKQKVDTHNKQGERERYFPDDDKYRLQDMFTQEKLNSVEDSNYEFAKLIGKGASRLEKGEGDLDEMFEESARYKESDGKVQRREREQAVKEHKKVSRALEGCRRCVDSKQMLKHLIIALGSKVYLSLPPYKSLTPGHCLLAPTLHTSCSTQLDEDVWAEMQTFRKTLTKMFADKGQDVVFFETARNLHNFPHMVMECVPLDQESGSLAPIYFKKAIQECETEWSTNKKLVELAGKGLRRAIPKGLPYFAVNFGNDDGFGHVIEDEHLFPQNFAQETIGGMLDLEHHLWRKQHNENFDAQRRKVLEFAKDWSPYDFTSKKTEDTSSSDSD